MPLHRDGGSAVARAGGRRRGSRVRPAQLPDATHPRCSVVADQHVGDDQRRVRTQKRQGHRLFEASGARLKLPSSAALAAAGYRVAREAHHYRVLQSVAFAANAQPALVRLLDAFRKKRNIGGYETAGATSDASEMASLLAKLRERVEREIRTSHPELLP